MIYRLFILPIRIFLLCTLRLGIRNSIVLVLILGASFLALRTNAQIKAKDNWLERQLRINFLLSPSLEYEHPVYNDFAINAQAGVLYAPSWGALWSNAKNNYFSNDHTPFYYQVFPYIRLDFKYIYNRDRRTRLGKKLPFNAGDYVALRTIYYFPSVLSNQENLQPIRSIGVYPVWGLQRAFGNIHFAFDFGIPYAEDYLGNKRFTPKVNLTLGYNMRSWLPQPRQKSKSFLGIHWGKKKKKEEPRKESEPEVNNLGFY